MTGLAIAVPEVVRSAVIKAAIRCARFGASTRLRQSAGPCGIRAKLPIRRPRQKRQLFTISQSRKRQPIVGPRGRSSRPTTSSTASRKATNSSIDRTGTSGRRSRCDGPPAESGSAVLLPCFVEESGERIVLVE